MRRGPRRLLRFVKLTAAIMAFGLAQGLGEYGGFQIILDERKKSVDNLCD